MAVQHETLTEIHGTACHHVANAAARLALTGFPIGGVPAAAFTLLDVQTRKLVIQDDDGTTWYTTSYPTPRWVRMIESENWRSSVNVDLTTNNPTAVLAVVLSGLAISSKFMGLLSCRIGMYTAADHAVNGMIDITVSVGVVTDGAGVATCTLQTVPVADVSLVPAAMVGATATVGVTAGGFTVTATRPADTECYAFGEAWVPYWRNVT